MSDSDSDSGVVCELPTQLSSFPRQRSRNPQVVTSVGHRRKAVRWMIQHEAAHGDKGMYAKAVDRYPAIFNSATRAANLAKALDWWKKREKNTQYRAWCNLCFGAAPWWEAAPRSQGHCWVREA
ncbi:hypothetical protein P3T76_000776 [Phytophthora citrophthora]|uniref:Uncharacterized protein n=1 Tax=Phytophthora citrophthora TaxID=4793 RepID=A0AAD9LVT1_9STRA|nr:hypothetical protein P3T76_000776 [Phytophthora citrophthora]